VASIKHFHHYLYGRHFLVRSDHGALRWLLNFKNPEGQIARWFEILAAYDFEIEHRAGRSHANADAMSRRPCHKENCSHCSRTEQKCQLEIESGDKSPRNSDININDNMGDNSTYVDQMLIEENAVVYVTTRSGKRLDKSPSMSNHEAIERGNDPSKLDSDSSFDLTAEKFIEYQKNDIDLNFLISWKEKGEKPVWETVSPCSPVKYHWSRWDTLYLKAGILYRKWENADGHGEKWLVVLPQTLIKFVLTQLHNSVTGGHFGIKKTLSKVRERYSWFKQRQDVENWCRHCDICASKKRPNKKPRAPLQQYNVGAPLERIAVDILGPLPRTNKGNRYLLVVGDYFSKWAEAIPIRDQEATTVANKLVDRVISILGVPMEIHSDQGSNFESQVFKEMCKLLGLHKTRTTSLRPQSDGMVERFNATIENMLASFESENQKDWDEYIFLLMMAYRAAVHEATKVSPYEMMFGRTINLPIDLVIGHPDSNYIFPVYSSGYVFSLSKKLEKIHEFALSSNNMKRLYDRSKHFNSYNAGDAVWFYNPLRTKGLNPKLQRPWQGPFLVTERINDVIDRIQRSPRAKPKAVHHDRLKLYIGEQTVSLT
jgi:transposase InsO family protein